jgi:hypothetical protein
MSKDESSSQIIVQKKVLPCEKVQAENAKTEWDADETLFDGGWGEDLTPPVEDDVFDTINTKQMPATDDNKEKFKKAASIYLLCATRFSQAYTFWESKKFDRFAFGVVTEIKNQMNIMLDCIKELQDLFPRKVAQKADGEIRLEVDPYFTEWSELMLTDVNKGLFSNDPNERKYTLFKIEQRTEVLRNTFKVI